MPKLLPLSALARRLGVSPETVHRWHLKGLKGGRLRLKALKVGGRWCSTRRWLQAFLAACQAPEPVAYVEPPAEHSRRVARVIAELEARK